MKKKDRLLFIIFIIPIFALLILFRYYPLFSGVYYSFTNWNVLTAQFTGFQNYLNLFTDNLFLVSIRNVLVYVLVTTVITTVMCILGAELIFNLKFGKLRTMWKYLFVVPMIIPFTVSMLIWQFIYNPYLGVLNRFLGLIGLGSFAIPWLGNPQTALYAVSFVGFPFLSTAQFLIILSALQSLDHSIMDATKVDGAGTLKRIFKIDLPLITDKVVLAIMLSVITNFQAISNFYILTQGGPGSSTLVPGLYLYQQAFEDNSMGYACTIGVVMALITLFLILAIQKVEKVVEKHYA